MPKAMIVTVGKQCEQAKICFENKKPEYLVILGTDSPVCKNSINELLKSYKLDPTNYKIYDDIKDNPNEIGNIIKKFKEGYDWLTKHLRIPEDEIEVNPTGGRKWMSAGVIMISSFLGLKMYYVQDKTESEPEKVTPLGNAYEQTGFLKEAEADKLFNEYNFSEASSIYGFLMTKIQDPRKIEIKKIISESYLHWFQFKFKQASDFLEQSIIKVDQFKLLTEHQKKLHRQLENLKLLKRNDEHEVKYFDLLKDDNFVNKMLLTLMAQSERFSEKAQYDQAVIILYRILELIAQYRLAKNDVNAGKISDNIRQRYNEQYKKITKDIFQAESEIPDKISLVQCWILLYCIQDDLVKKEKPEFLKGLRKNTETRNLLWWEHGNKTIDKEKYKEFRGYVVENWLSKIIPVWKTEIEDFNFIKF